jgi:hypothetical protein
MPERGGRDLLNEWRRLMEGMIASAASLGGRAELPRQLVAPMQRQLELLEEVIERERRLQRQVTGRLVAPFDVIFDLLEENGLMLRRQAEALEAAGHALQDAAGLVKTQAELFERTIGVLRQPTELAKAAAGLERRQRGERARSGRAKPPDEPKPADEAKPDGKAKPAAKPARRSSSGGAR